MKGTRELIEYGTRIPGYRRGLVKSFEVSYGICEDTQSVVVILGFGAGPVGVVGSVDVSFGVGHETEYAAGGIAEAGDVISRAVGIDGEIPELTVLIDVAKGDLSVVAHLL